MWMYDLTGGLRIGKLHKRLIDRRGAGPHADAAAGTGWPAATSTTTPRPTTPGSRSPSPAPPRSTTAPSSPTGAAVVGLAQGRRRPGRRRRRSRPTAGTIDGRGPRRGQRRRRVGRRGAGARRGHAPRHASGRPRASTSPCRGTRCATTSPPSSPCPKDRRSVFVVPWGDRRPTSAPPTPTTTARRRPAVHRRGRRLPARRHQRVARREPLTPADVSARGPACARWCKAAHERPHRRPVPPPPGAPVGERRGHRHRRQAHDLPGDGGRHRRRGRRACSGEAAAPDGAAAPRREPHGASCACGAPTATTPTAAADARRHLAGRYGGEARVVAGHDRAPTRRWASRWSPASPTCGPRPCTPPATRWPAPSTTCSPAAPGPGCSARDASAAAADDVAALVGAELGLGRRRAGRARSSAYRGRSVERRARRRRPARRAPLDACTSGLTPAPCRPGPGAPDAADRPRPATPAAATARLGADRGRGRPTPCVDRLARRVRRRSRPTPPSAAEASRDWWPLAMTWALDGQVGRRWPRSWPGPRRPTRWPPCSRVCNEARVPGHRRRRAQRRVRRRRSRSTAASCST